MISLCSAVGRELCRKNPLPGQSRISFVFIEYLGLANKGNSELNVFEYWLRLRIDFTYSGGQKNMGHCWTTLRV